MSGPGWYFLMEGLGKEQFGPYDTEEEAREGMNRVRSKADKEETRYGIFRFFYGPYLGEVSAEYSGLAFFDYICSTDQDFVISSVYEEVSALRAAEEYARNQQYSGIDTEVVFVKLMDGSIMKFEFLVNIDITINLEGSEVVG